MESREIGPELIERWALHYLERYANSAENLRRVLMRRVRRHSPQTAPQVAALIDALVARYRESGVLDDAAYAAGRVQSLHRRGDSLQAIRARLTAKGVAAADVAEALSGLRSVAADPDLGAACGFARAGFKPGASLPEQRKLVLAMSGRCRWSGKSKVSSILDCYALSQQPVTG